MPPPSREFTGCLLGAKSFSKVVSFNPPVRKGCPHFIDGDTEARRDELARGPTAVRGST